MCLTAARALFKKTWENLSSATILHCYTVAADLWGLVPTINQNWPMPWKLRTRMWQWQQWQWQQWQWQQWQWQWCVSRSWQRHHEDWDEWFHKHGMHVISNHLNHPFCIISIAICCSQLLSIECFEKHQKWLKFIMVSWELRTEHTET